MSQSRKQRALTQKIFLLDAKQFSDKWKFKVLGYSGSKYVIQFSKIDGLNCSCPDFKFNNNICKHIFFIIGRIAQDTETFNKIKSRYDNIFEINPNISNILFNRLNNVHDTQEETEKIELDYDCRICYENLDSKIEPCNTCNNYLHSECLIRWLKYNNSCPFCRSEWIYKNSTEDEFKFFSN